MGTKKLLSAVVALTALVAHPLVVDAQERRDPTVLSLEDLMATPVDEVHGASKFLQKITDAPASITVVTAEEIRLHGYRTLADVLRSVDGISISHDRNYTYVGMRGLARTGDLNSRVLVLVDGHRMNNNVDDQALIGTAFQVDVDLIDRVEVIRGPSAAVYGSTAFSAVIRLSPNAGGNSTVSRRQRQRRATAPPMPERHGASATRAGWSCSCPVRGGGPRAPAACSSLSSPPTTAADTPNHLTAIAMTAWRCRLREATTRFTVCIRDARSRCRQRRSVLSSTAVASGRSTGSRQATCNTPQNLAAPRNCSHVLSRIARPTTGTIPTRTTPTRTVQTS